MSTTATSAAPVSASGPAPAAGAARRWADVAAAVRLHIIGIAVCATVVFGYLFTDRYPVGLGLLVGFDWCLVNLLNRATDVAEDRRNGIAATEWVARHVRPLVVGCLVVLAGSLVAGFLWLTPALAVGRVLFHALGLGYSFRGVPTPRGRRRFKDLYLLKNAMSAVMFILSVGLGPLLWGGAPRRMAWAGIGTVLLFFFLFEHTFEIIYDLRDADGDRALGVPTYPVVHGPATAALLVYALCGLATAVLVAGRLAGTVLTRELLMGAAPLAQAAFLRWRGPTRVTRADCIGLTWAGVAMLLVYLAGTALWAWAGLPQDL